MIDKLVLRFIACCTEKSKVNYKNITLVLFTVPIELPFILIVIDSKSVEKQQNVILQEESSTKTWMV